MELLATRGVRTGEKIMSCGCKPGTRDSGWMERRSAECVRKEMEIFCAVIKKMQEGK